jgi:FkbM family methyltransferase
MSRDIRSGALTEPELDLVSPSLRQDETAVDLGANFGMYCARLSKVVGRGGRVYAFEPVPFTVATLRRVVRLLGLSNVTIVDKGVGEHSGTVSFSVPEQASGAPISGLAHMSTRDDQRPGREIQVGWDKMRQVEVEVVALDEFLPREIEVTFIKADVEGAELLAFRGARRLIERCHPTVLCEIDPWYLEGYGFAVAELLGFFDELGYAVYRYEAGRLCSMTDASEVSAANYVFIHPDRRSRFDALRA